MDGREHSATTAPPGTPAITDGAPFAGGQADLRARVWIRDRYSALPPESRLLLLAESFYNRGGSVITETDRWRGLFASATRPVRTLTTQHPLAFGSLAAWKRNLASVFSGTGLPAVQQ